MTLGWPRCRDCGHRVQSDLGQSTQRLPGAGTARGGCAGGDRGRFSRPHRRHSGLRPPAIEHPLLASHPRQSQQWPGTVLGIATAIVASAPIRAVPTPGGIPASVVRTSPAPIGSLIAVIPVWRAMRRNPSAPPLAPMTGHRVPTSQRRRSSRAGECDRPGLAGRRQRSGATTPRYIS